MHNDIQVAGQTTRRELEGLFSLEAIHQGGRNESIMTTVLKILAIIAGLFLALLAITSMRPEGAFISITLIAITVGAIIAGADKIVAIFPRRIWIWSPPRTYSSPVVDQVVVPTTSWYRPWTWRGRGSDYRGNASGHSPYDHSHNGSGGHRRASGYAGSSGLDQSEPGLQRRRRASTGSVTEDYCSPPAYYEPTRPTGSAFVSGQTHTGVGGGHAGNPTTPLGGRTHVVPGGGHDRRQYGSNVPVGSRKEE